MPELKGLLQLVFPLVVVLALALLQAYVRKSGRRRIRKAPDVPPEGPTPERVRLGPLAQPSPASRGPEVARPPEEPRSSRPTGQAPGAAAGDRWPPLPGTRVRLRDLLANPRGRRVVILAHEILRQPGGMWREEERRRPL